MPSIVIEGHQKITPFLWYNDSAEEAMQLYTTLFPNARIGSINRYGKGMPFPEGTLFTGTFYIGEQEFMVINGGPHFQFTPAVSLFVRCADQAEVDYLWEHLLANGGKEERCGWLRDKFGLTWQIIPNLLGELLGDKDSAKSGRVMQAMMQMVKLDCAELQKAYDGV